MAEGPRKGLSPHFTNTMILESGYNLSHKCRIGIVEIFISLETVRILCFGVVCFV